MGEAKRKKAGAVGSTADPSFQKSVFTQAFDQTCELLDDPDTEDLRAMITTFRGRNALLDRAATTYAVSGKAECRIGCSSCCHQMVLCTPFEVFSVARYLLKKKTAAEIAQIKERLIALSHLPLDPAARQDAQHPCALLENDRCTIYEHRPSVCRTALSASRTACENCLAAKTGTVPFLLDAAAIAAVLQLAIDHAVITRRNLSTEKVELSRALLTALDDFEGTLTRWTNCEDPFQGAQVHFSGYPTNREMAKAAAKRFGIT